LYTFLILNSRCVCFCHQSQTHIASLTHKRAIRSQSNVTVGYTTNYLHCLSLHVILDNNNMIQSGSDVLMEGNSVEYVKKGVDQGSLRSERLTCPYEGPPIHPHAYRQGHTHAHTHTHKHTHTHTRTHTHTHTHTDRHRHTHNPTHFLPSNARNTHVCRREARAATEKEIIERCVTASVCPVRPMCMDSYISHTCATISRVPLSAFAV
jgi:hypothetical protein